ncbi:MAG: hypothetical protein H6718_31540 [Polyangiaceae bacterium]|nr:hypothetical protein [Polyangiaceae bacterium]
MSSSYRRSDTLAVARQQYFEDNHFGPDGGYNDPWVDFKLGPIPFPFPNTAGRVRAVGYHDLHHVLTGYQTDLQGEIEIAAWEIGAGCKGFLAAWQLNLSSMGFALFFSPRRSFRAFVRGRRSHSLYGLELPQLLQRGVGEVADELGVDEPTRARATDIPLYVMASFAGLVAGTAMLGVLIPILPFALLGMNAKRRLERARLNATA